MNSSSLYYYFYRSPWFRNQEEEDYIYNVLLLVSSFSFESPVLLTCFIHASFLHALKQPHYSFVNSSCAYHNQIKVGETRNVVILSESILLFTHFDIFSKLLLMLCWLSLPHFYTELSRVPDLLYVIWITLIIIFSYFCFSPLSCFPPS